jgi:hypothetical protein
MCTGVVSSIRRVTFGQQLTGMRFKSHHFIVRRVVCGATCHEILSVLCYFMKPLTSESSLLSSDTITILWIHETGKELKSIIFWDMTPCSPLSFNPTFRRNLSPPSLGSK